MTPDELKDLYRRWLLEVWGPGRYELLGPPVRGGLPLASSDAARPGQ